MPQIHSQFYTASMKYRFNASCFSVSTYYLQLWLWTSVFNHFSFCCSKQISQLFTKFNIKAEKKSGLTWDLHQLRPSVNTNLCLVNAVSKYYNTYN